MLELIIIKFTQHFTANDNIDTHVTRHINDKLECVIKTTNIFPTEDINNEENITDRNYMSDNVSTEIQNESISNVVLPEHNLYKDLNQSNEMNSTNGTNLTLDFDQSLVFLFEELNDLGISPNNILNYSNNENNMINDNLDDCRNNNDNNNIESRNNGRKSREKEREREMKQVIIVLVRQN